MARPRRSTADAFYDVFADFPLEDQAAALKILEQINRLAIREESKRKPEAPGKAILAGRTEIFVDDRRIESLGDLPGGRNAALELERGDEPFSYDRAAPSTPQRVYGSATCVECGIRVDVVFPYINSSREIGLVDHTTPEGGRCTHAGLGIWSEELGWFDGRYPDAGITKPQEWIWSDELGWFDGITKPQESKQ